MKIEDIKVGDIIEYRNGNTKIVSSRDTWIFKELYDENLKCVTNSAYDIVNILRPEYTKVYERIEEKTK